MNEEQKVPDDLLAQLFRVRQAQDYNLNWEVY